MFPLGSIILLNGVDNTLKLTNLNVSDFDIFSAYAGAEINADGTLKKAQGSASYFTTHSPNEWMHGEFKATPGFDPSLYEGGLFSWTGNTPSGDLRDQYISLDNSPRWYYSVGIGIRSGNGQLRVREIANPSNEVTCTLTLYAEGDTGE